MYSRIVAAFTCLVSFSSFANQFTLDKAPQFGQLSNFEGSALCQVAENTTQYLSSNPDDTFAVHQGSVFVEEVTLVRVEKTLRFLCETYRQDVRAKRPSRLHDREFLKAHFDFYRWTPDKNTANKLADASTNDKKANLLRGIPDQQILLTKYYTKLLNGSMTKTEEFDQALYALPYDEQGMSLQQAEQKQASLTRFAYTRQQIIEGALLTESLAEPLVWLSEEALHDVLLQGTGVLQIGDDIAYYNVHRNNGIAYDYAIGKRDQARYWYFAKVPSVMGYGETIDSKIAIEPQVTFAGNVAQLGLGKLFMVSFDDNNKPTARLGVLADQGGAFDNNLFQLDLLVDSYRGWSDYYQANKGKSDYADAWLMLVK